jgi:hypothetical protein
MIRAIICRALYGMGGADVRRNCGCRLQIVKVGVARTSEVAWWAVHVMWGTVLGNLTGNVTDLGDEQVIGALLDLECSYW